MGNLKHIAIIMDGNGRWATARNKKRIDGHYEGSKRIKEIAIYGANKYALEVLTVYAFSTENWKRPNSEVDYIFKLPSIFFNIFLKDFIANNISISFIGDLEAIPKATYRVLMNSQEKTSHCTGMKLIFAINYGSRNEMIKAMAAIKNDDSIQASDIDETLFESHLMTANLPNVDLMIRTSGEKRLSNFLLWQCAYSELYFEDALWPDYSCEHLDKAILEFENRNRRFGGV